MDKVKCHAQFISNENKTDCGYYYIKNKQYIIYEKDDDISPYYDSFVIDENGERDYFSINSIYQNKYFSLYEWKHKELLKKAKIIRKLGNKLLDRL